MRTLFEIPATAEHTVSRQQGLLTNRQCEQFGITRQTRHRLVAQGRRRRPVRGVYDTDPVPLEARVRDDWFSHAERWRTWLALLSHGDAAIAVGAAALVLHDVQGLPRDFRPEVAMPDGSWRTSRFGAVRQYKPFPMIRIGDRDVARIDHALAQALPGLPRESVLAVLDDVARRLAMTPARLAAVHDLLRGRPGAAGVHELFPLVDGRAESPAESAVRLSCVDHGVPPDDIQVRFVVGGKVVARVDLLWRLPDGRWLVVEVDGVRPHSAPRALVRDAPRQNQLLASGHVIMLRFKPRDNDKPGGVGREVARVLRKHGWRPGRYATPGATIELTPAPAR
jgi:hypothetical protein